MKKSLFLLAFIVATFGLLNTTSVMASSPQVIHTNDAPAPIGPYNQAILANHMLFLSGQIAIDPNTNHLVEGDAAAQAHQVMENLKNVLHAAHMGFNDVIKTTVFVSDLKDYHAINEVYSRYFTGHNAPARSAVQVARLPLNAKLEIEMVAYKD